MVDSWSTYYNILFCLMCIGVVIHYLRDEDEKAIMGVLILILMAMLNG